MCGIVGIISNNANLVIDEMLSRISHRGPDDSGLFVSEGIALGHQRLSIQDLSQNGHQPMFTDDKRYLIIFNGEIYNHWDIREKIKSKYTFKSTSDTETVLYGYIEYGDELFNMLNGIFALCIYDTQTNDIIVARDQFGVKPLYYTLNNTIFSFSSELKAILDKNNNENEISEEALFNYLYFLWSPGENTPLKNYKKLLPGHFIKGNSKDLKSFKIHKYYEIPFNTNRIHLTEEDLIVELDQKLMKAIDRQLLSDVPVGFFLSGGLDSSLIVAMAKKMRPNFDTTCFTIDTRNDSDREGFANDLDYAKQVAKYLDVKLEIIKADINITNDFDKMIWHLDEPQADPAPLNVLNICKRARELGYTVLLGGTAGDDLFSGYRRHQQLYYNNKIEFIPIAIKRALYKLAKLLPSSNAKIRRARKFLSYFNASTPDKRLVSPFGWMEKAEVLNLFSDQFKKKLNNFDPSDSLINTLSNISSQEDDLNKLLFLEMKYFLTDHNLNYTDKMSMAVGVEVRVPFLDKELVEFSTLIPVEFKMKGVNTKYILKKVAEKYLPHDVIYRPKSGFGAPVRDWIINDLQEFIKVKLSKERIESRGIFNYDNVRKLIERNSNDKIDASYSIWALLSIESWFMQFYDSKK